MKSIPPQWIRSPQWRPVESTGVFELSPWHPHPKKHIPGRFKTGSSKIPCTPTKINSIDSIDTWNLKKIKANLETNLFQGPKSTFWGAWRDISGTTTSIYLLVMWEPQTQTQSYQSGRKNARNHCAIKSSSQNTWNMELGIRNWQRNTVSFVL